MLYALQENTQIDGSLSEAYKAAEAVRINLAAWVNELYPGELSVYIPMYNTHTESPAMHAELHAAYNHISFPGCEQGSETSASLLLPSTTEKWLNTISNSVTSVHQLLLSLRMASVTFKCFTFA